MSAIVERAGASPAPLSVAVCGRSGVGRRTVARALDGVARHGCVGISVTELTDFADVIVYVTAEVVKPEDRDAVAAARRPVLAVLNKADLAGLAGPPELSPDGPAPLARAQCESFSQFIGAPMEPMIGLLAVAACADSLAGPDGALWAAVRTLAGCPDVFLDVSVDGFLAAAEPALVLVPHHVRRRLLDTLDLFGLALAVAAVRQGGSAARVRALLRQVSGIDAVVAQVIAAGAQARYRRVRQVIAELETVAVTDGRVAELLCCDEVVLARMAAAEDLAAATGLDVAASRDPAEHLTRAIRWQRYSRGPVSALHRACGADIARGSLRLWAQATGAQRDPCPGPPGASR